MTRSAVVRDSDGFVENVIELESGSSWIPPDGHTVVSLDDEIVSPGDTWDGSVFIPRIPTQEEIDERGRQDRFGELDEKLRARTMSLPELHEIVAKMRGLE